MHLYFLMKAELAFRMITGVIFWSTPALLSVFGPYHLPATVLFLKLEAVHCLGEATGPQGHNLTLMGLFRAPVNTPSFLLRHS